MNYIIKRLISQNRVLNDLDCRFYKYRQRKRAERKFRKDVNVTPLRLVIGAGGICSVGWIPTEIDNLNLLNPKQWKSCFKQNTIDAILAEHVWEHLTVADGVKAAKQCYNYLKPGGYLRVAVPDGFCPDVEYIDCVRPGGSGSGAQGHKVLYNYQTFVEIFSGVGFRVDLLEYYDNRGEFHYVDWNPDNGIIRRSKRFDQRNEGGRLKYTSIIMDAHKGK